MKNIKIFAFLAVFLLSAAVSSAWAFKTETPVIYSVSFNGRTISIITGNGINTASWQASHTTSGDFWTAGEKHDLANGMSIVVDATIKAQYSSFVTWPGIKTSFTFTAPSDIAITGVKFKNSSNDVAATSSEPGSTFTVTLGANTSFTGFEVTYGYISGSCGSKAKWSLSKQDKKYTALTISGSGDMKNYGHTTDGNTTTWRTDAPWGWDLTRVTIDNSITGIGDYAFIGNQKLSSLTIGTGVKSIGTNAFGHCDALTEVTLPASVSTLGDGAFKNSSGLKRVNIQKDAGLVTLGNDAFGGTALQYIVAPTPALAVQYKTATNWKAHDSKLRVALGNYLFTATGTANDAAYEIATEADLRNLSEAVNDVTVNIGNGKTFRQTANITLSEDFLPIGSASSRWWATYDGGGYIISGLKIVSSGNSAETYGLFGYVDHGTVKNVVLMNPSFPNDNYSAALIGILDGGSAMNCYAYGTSILIKKRYNTPTLTNVGRVRKISARNNVFIAAPTATEGFTYDGEYYYREKIQLILGNGTLSDGTRTVYSANGTAFSGDSYTVNSNDGDVTLTADIYYSVDPGDGLQVTTTPATTDGNVKYYSPDTKITVKLTNASSIVESVNGVSGYSIADNRRSFSFTMPSKGVKISATTTEVHTVSVPNGMTLSAPYKTIAGVNYYKKGQTVTFGFSGSGSVVYFVNGERIEGNSVTVGQEDLTVEIGVPYIDKNGETQILEPGKYTVLTGNTGVSNLGGGWYVVQGAVEYTNQVKFEDDAHLILADGAEMEIESETYGIQADKNLTIYGQSKQSDQSDQSGTLKVTATGSGIYSRGNITIIGGTVTDTSTSGNGIYSNSGDITIIGGSVTATGTNGIGIFSYNGVTISGGTVRATGNSGIYSNSGDITIIGGSVTATGTKGRGIDSYNGVTINGGKVEATGTSSGIYCDKGVTISGGTVKATGNNNGIYSNSGNITLGWTNSTDSIKASSYYDKNGVSIAEGKSFKDEDGNVYSGTLTGGQLSAIKGKKLEPCYAVTFDAQNGDDPIMLPATFDENGVAHVKKPNDPNRDGFTFEGWFTTKDGNTEFDFSAAITGNTTAYAKWGVPYIDEKGAPKSVTDFTVLIEDNKPNEDGVIELSGGWYVVQGEVSYEKTVTFSGDAHLILADGATMTIVTEGKGIEAAGNLTIYGQSKQSDKCGTLEVTATSTNGSGIYSYSGDITINGGTVTATGTSYGIESYNNVTINGGSVTATGSSYCIYGYNGVTISGGSVTATSTGDYGIYSRGNITISGGKVTATGRDGIRNYNGNITLGWTNSTDFIKASSYYSIAGSVSIAEGKSFKDEDGKAYSGTIDDVSDIAVKKLEPCYAVTFDAQNGDDPIMLPATFDENGVAHVEKPNDPIRSGFTFEGWFTATDGNAEFDFTKAVTENTTAYAHWNENTPVEYIDENGGTNETKNYILLTNDIKVDNLPGGWYVVQGDVKYTRTVSFSGNAHLILADGAKMEIVTEGRDEHGINANGNLTIYGQNEQRGILNDTAKGINGSGIYSSEGNITISGGKVAATGTNRGIYGYEGVTINGGKVTAASTNGNGIYGYEGVTINGGSVKATSKSGFGINSSNGVTISGGSVKATSTGDYGIYSSSGKITISGGTVTATGNRDGIRSYNGNIILGWTNSTDFIKASSYYSKKGSVQIAEGKSFKDEKGRLYSGTLSDNQIAAISHQTIEPLPWKNLGDYAAVQIFEDENGKKHAVIDGEYEGEKTVDIPNEIAVDAVDYIRNFDANTPSTVLMPVRLPSCATVNAKFYKLDEVYQSGYRWVAKVQNIDKALPQANTAYAVMLPTAGKLEFNFEGCATAEEKQAIVQTDEIQTSGNTDGSWYFTGTYSFKRWTETENKDEVGLVYGFAGSNEEGIAKGQFGRVDFGAHANPLRCYLRKKDKSVVLKTQTLAKAAPQVLKAAPYNISLLPETIDVEFVDDDENGEHTTAIGRMDTRTGKIRLLRTDRTYDLKGRRVNDVKRAAKGAYYGKKF